MRKVNIKNMSLVSKYTNDIKTFLYSIPDINFGRDIKVAGREIVNARKKRKSVMLGIGGHVIKCGLGPILSYLISEHIITHLVINGAAMIHDTEIALYGSTSENVDNKIREGKFGFDEQAEELCYKINVALNKESCKEDPNNQISVGETIRDFVYGQANEFSDYSILCSCYRHQIPVTVHTAIGADINHMHSTFNGEVWGKALHNDFKNLCTSVSTLDNGVYINAGSAVILPEVFMKAFSIAVKKRQREMNLTTIALDFMKQYRPMRNVVERPSNKGIYIVGSHELTIPLLAAFILQER